MNGIVVLIFQLAVLIFSVIIHEVSHGVAALRLGDTTARDMGRLTLNPLKHLDPFGSIILPISLFLLSNGAFVIGWAKPVPYNPYNLRNPRAGAGIIGAVGPLSNILVAGIFSVILRLLLMPAGMQALIIPVSYIIGTNILLAVFNLVPLPPLDGSNILFALLPSRWQGFQVFLNRYGFFILILFIFFGFNLLMPIVSAIYGFFAGPAALY